MRITYVEKTGRKKVRVTMDDGESFVVSERDWESFGGKAGEDLEDELILKLYREYMLPRAKFRALNLLKVRDRSRQELAQRLKMDGYPESVIKDTMAYVDSYHYLDDARFARNYVDYRGSRKSRRELEYELKMKGICVQPPRRMNIWNFRMTEKRFSRFLQNAGGVIWSRIQRKKSE